MLAKLVFLHKEVSLARAQRLANSGQGVNRLMIRCAFHESRYRATIELGF